MKPNSIFLRWNRPVPGHQAEAVEVFRDLAAYIEKKEADGVVDGFESAILAPHGSDMNGFILVGGTPENLADLRHSAEMSELVLRCNMHLDGFGLIDAFAGGMMGGLIAKMGEISRR